VVFYTIFYSSHCEGDHGGFGSCIDSCASKGSLNKGIVEKKNILYKQAMSVPVTLSIDMSNTNIIKKQPISS
jgi:heterodisulfide reductase subunit A-like polyferredoxin